MKKFIGADREQRMLMPYDLGDWLPNHHLARFVVDVVDKLDMRGVYSQYKGVGSTAYDPRMLLSLLFCGYPCTLVSVESWQRLVRICHPHLLTGDL